MIKPYYETELGKLYHGDCLEIMPHLEPVDLVLCDLPYGVTSCEWDKKLSLALLWDEYEKIIKKGRVIALTATIKFCVALINSNPDWFKYEWLWNKKHTSNPALAKIQPLRCHEFVLIFGDGKTFYNPILEPGSHITRRFGKDKKTYKSGVAGDMGPNYKQGVGYPKTILNFDRPNNMTGGNYHPSQKPNGLFIYLIETYTNSGEIVLDNCLGSGTTALACERLNRRWIGIEIEEKYCEIAAKRIENERKQRKLF